MNDFEKLLKDLVEGIRLSEIHPVTGPQKLKEAIKALAGELEKLRKP